MQTRENNIKIHYRDINSRYTLNGGVSKTKICIRICNSIRVKREDECQMKLALSVI